MTGKALSMDNVDLTQLAGHGLSTAAIIGTWFGWLPHAAAAAALIWYIIQIYSSVPVQNWMHTRRMRRLASIKREMARIEAAELLHGDHERRHAKHRD